MTYNLNQSMDDFIARTLALSQQRNQPLMVEYDGSWPSPCYQEEKAEHGLLTPWLPELQRGGCRFDDMEKALDMPLNEQFCQFFTRYFSFHLKARASQGECELLQVCSEQDFERLQENLIGHVLMKRRLKQPPTLFFALTDDDDFILSVDNASGEVVLERVGRLPEKPLAENLATFIAGLEPVL